MGANSISTPCPAKIVIPHNWKDKGTYTVSKLCEANNNPVAEHEAIKLGGKLTDAGIRIRVFADASYADGLRTRASTGAHVVMMGIGPVFWRTKRQTIVAASTAEVEFMNLTPAGMSALWIAKMVSEMGFKAPKPIVIFTDSQNARLTVLNAFNSDCTRHMHVKYEQIIYRVQAGDFEVRHIGTTEMAADGLTEPLFGIKHGESLKQLGM
ncbi:hypothetical protein S7711_09305 [Stachybotrys chartarum IBT 7711]|uniref:RNase H type-1 domain-containing protein n=1 Tax=Stachybotrys chartarum (strain CBS 109288 / IBT 7711) TaxID=1280523 RepID=A0A084BCG3_STACB|nr:hypothetical protein S7711_09305 [Stachybotrys chartarum IBT 7711]